MAFATDKLKPISSKVIIFQIDIGKNNDFWVNYAAGVWIINFDNMYSKITSFTTYPDAPEITQVGSVIANGVQLSKVSSPLACETQDSSFYYEAGTLTLYVHCPFGNDPDLFNMRIGQVYGFRKGGSRSDYGGVIHEDRLIQAPNITISKDPQFYGNIKFDGFSASIINSDGQYDFLTRNNYIFGNKGRVLAGFEDYNLTDFQQIYEGTIGRIVTKESQVNFEIKDPRVSYQKAIPTNTFTTTEYPDIASGNVGKPKPRVFGTCRNIPIYVVDEDRSTGDTGFFTGKIADTEYTSGISAVSAVFVNGLNKTTETTKDLGLKEIYLSTSDYEVGDEVTANVVGEVTDTGGVIENGGEVIRKLIYDYYEYPYNGDFYNISGWQENRARDICLYLNSQKPIIDVIGSICADGIQGDFFIDGNNKLNLKITRETDPSGQTIFRNAIISTPEIEDNPDNIITSSLIGYSKDWNSGEYYLYVDTSNESTIFDKFPLYKQQRFDTLLTTNTDAADYSDVLFTKSDDVETLLKVKVAGWACIDCEVADIVTVYADRTASDWYKRCKCEIVSATKDFNEHIVTLTLRLIERLDAVPYTESYFYTANDYTDPIYYTANSDTDPVYYAETINEAL
jgi:hypothetical protein